MDKKTKITSLTTAALATLLLASANLGSEVKADTVKNPNASSTQKAQSPKENAQANINSAQTEVNQAQSKVDEADKNLASAKQDAQVPDKAYADQDAQVKKAETDFNNKQDAKTKAQNQVNDAQKLVDQATDENIAAAKKAVEDKNSEISNKQQDLKDTQAQEPAKQNAVDKANSDVKIAQSNLDGKTAAKAKADTAVKNAQDALDPAKADQANKEAKDAEQKVAQDKIDLENNQKDIAAKTTKKQQAENAKNNAESAKTSVQSEQMAALKDYNSKKDIVDKSTQEINNKNTEIDNLTKTLTELNEKSKNNIVIPDINKYKQAYNDYKTTKSLTDADLTYVKAAYNNNKFISSDEDKDITVDINNLTDDQLKEISLFANDLLNGLRSQLGWSSDEVTTGSLKLAKDIAANYIADDYTNTSWHDVSGINRAASKNGLATSEGSDQYYEDKSDSSFVSTPTISMDELKENIYNSISLMIFPVIPGYYAPGKLGYEMGHAAFLLGADSSSNELEPDNDSYGKSRIEGTRKVAQTVLQDAINDEENYYDTHEININGVSYYYYPGENKEYSINNRQVDKAEFIKQLKSAISTIPTVIDGQYTAVVPTYISNVVDTPFGIHFINVAVNDILDGSKFNTEVVPSYATQITNANESLAAAKKDLEKLEADEPAKKAAKEQAYNKLTKLNDKLATATTIAQKATDAYNSADKALQDAKNESTKLQSTLEKDTEDSKAKQQKANEFNKSQEAKEKTLKTAQDNQVQAQQAVEDAKTQLSNATQELETAKTAKSDLEKEIANKQEAIKAAKSELEDLTAKRDALINAPQTLKTAKSNLDAAEQAVDTAEATLKMDQNKLKDLQKPKDEADAKVKTAQDAYDAANAELTDAQNKLTQAQNALAKIERQEQEAAELAAQEAQAQAAATKKAEELKQAATETKSIKLTHNAYVYDKDGNAIQVNGQNKKLLKGDSINAYSNAKIVTISGKDFYQIGENEFVKVANTVAKKISVPKSAKLTHNAFIYNKNGKRIKLTLLKRDSIIKPTKLVTIKGKKYYQIGKNKFIKVANTKVKTRSIKKTATIKAKLNHKVATVDRSGKKNGHHVLGGRTYNFNEKRTVDGKTYYKIAGKNDWVPAKKLNLKK